MRHIGGRRVVQNRILLLLVLVKVIGRTKVAPRRRIVYAHEVRHVGIVALTGRERSIGVAIVVIFGRTAADQVGVRIGVEVAGRRPLWTDPVQVPVAPSVRIECRRCMTERGRAVVVRQRASQLGRDGAQARLRR